MWVLSLHSRPEAKLPKRAAQMSTPGAETSGFVTSGKLGIGPREEKEAIGELAQAALVEPGLQAAATVIASRAVPGELTVLAAGPLLPAATVKTTPFDEDRKSTRLNSSHT